MAAAAAPGSQPTTPPLPRSPPKYPDFCGRRRLQLEAQILGREIGYLEEELQSLEGIQSVSRCCKEVNEFVGTNPDPLIPPNKRRHRTCRICKWLGKKLCLCFSWVCCFRGCSLGLKRPSCTCSCLKNFCGCDCGFLHCCCWELSCCKPSCLNFFCCRPCCCQNVSCCKPRCPKCTGACGCCPKCTGACSCCPKCTGPCSCCPKCTGACSCCPKCTGVCSCCPKCTGACSCCPKCSGVCSCCPKCTGACSCCPKCSGVCSCCPKCSLGACSCWPKCSGACSCCPKCSGACNCCDVSCCIPPRLSCPEFSCGCVWSCPERSGVRLCPRCSKPCCISGCLC